MPAYGSLHFRVVAGKCTIGSRSVFSKKALDNGILRVSVDPKSGNITKLIDAGSGENFADPGVNGGLNAFRWQPARGAGGARPDTVVSVVLKESGPLLGEILVTSRAPGCRVVTRSVRLAGSEPYVEITDVVDKLPLLAKDGIHFGFGFAIPGAKTHVDVPWGVMQVEADQWPAANRAWLTTGHFVDISNETSGVTVCSLDAPLFESGAITGNNTAGWDGKGDVWPRKTAPSPTIYSWVMNNHWFTNTPLMQDGPVAFRYRVAPHGPYDAPAADRFARGQSQPLIALAADKNPIAEPFLRVLSDQVAVTILKSTADGKLLIVRLRSFSETDAHVRLSWAARQPRSVTLTNAFDDRGATELGNEVVVPAMGFVWLRVEW